MNKPIALTLVFGVVVVGLNSNLYANDESRKALKDGLRVMQGTLNSHAGSSASFVYYRPEISMEHASGTISVTSASSGCRIVY